MGFKIKNSLTGEFEKLPILTLKGEKGETGGVEEYNKVDYMGNKYETLKQANDANVEYAVKTAIGEFNYLDYEGQHITALDTIAGQAKNAVVKGQTLVNLAKSRSYVCVPNGGLRIDNIRENTKYLLRLNFTVKNASSTIVVQSYRDNSYIENTIVANNLDDKVALTFTTKPNVNSVRILNPQNAETNITIDDIMLIEYQEGMENWDIPYFEGMASVKAPVLESVGKNLFPLGNSQDMSSTRGVAFTQKDGKLLINGTATDTADYRVFNHNNNVEQMKKFNSLPVGTTITLSNNLGKECYFNVIRNGSSIYLKNTITIENGDKDINAFIRINRGETYNNTELNIQIEEGTVATPYEPYKSNILTTPEDLELRGIGDVQDTLDISTGEKVERIVERILNGSENWQPETAFKHDTLVEFKLNLKTNIKNLIADRFAVGGKEERAAFHENGNLYIRIFKSKLSSENVEGFKEWLANNNLTIQYELKTPVIKTVDLSDNHVYSYKGTTHYDCSSAEGSLVPTLSVKVPTDVQATIAQQRETIQTLNSENERLNQIQEALKASMLDSQVQLMNLSWDTDFEVFTLRESIAPKGFPMDSKTGSNIDKFSQAKFIIENDCPDLEKLNSQIEYYFSKDVFSQEQFEELTDLISIVKGGNGCEY